MRTTRAAAIICSVSKRFCRVLFSYAYLAQAVSCHVHCSNTQIMSLAPFTSVQPVKAFALLQHLDGRNGTHRGTRESASDSCSGPSCNWVNRCRRSRPRIYSGSTRSWPTRSPRAAGCRPPGASTLAAMPALFNGPLSAASQRQARVILNGLFTWLVDAGYLRGNPMALLCQRGRRPAARITRDLSLSLWDKVKRFVEQLPQQKAAQQAYYAHCR
ncbi:Hypothetical protein RBRH_01926 (plasmid) [Mycetohabitans rhizoxinica HKI 454]|uniref:Uncharacterized protein n=2 Tax=Burkholderiaceae TaxID=119060 RepID=E5AUI5_MYCRK|nr:Hypothetical protein RBRH_01926 [Mycetohabitans rhizoxinica HKI 454]